MKSIKYIIGAAVAGVMLFSSCESDYLETVPANSVSEKVIGHSLDNLYIALNGIHKEMVSQESDAQCLGGLPGIMMCLDAEGDDMTWKGNTWMKGAYLNWQCNLNATSFYNRTIWRLYYQWILNANKILSYVDEAEKTDAKLYNQVKGEALTFRAWSHFCLLQIYGKPYEKGKDNSQLGVVYRVEPNTEPQERATVEECYKLINKDLEEALQLLKDGKDVGVNHYSAMVVAGIRARVAMAMHDYDKAAQYAAESREMAKANGLDLMQGKQLYCGFADISTDTKEAMYAALTPDDMTVYFYSYYAFMSWNFNSSAIRGGVKCINKDTYNTMSDTDLRRKWWDPSGTEPVPTKSYKKNVYQNRKFTARAASNAVGNVAFMRLAEIYLTEAEALARAGKDEQAQKIFTEFQVTRDPEYVSKNNKGDALIEEIMNSRRVELWGEGFRFYDLKRIGKGMQRGSNFDVSFCGFLKKSESDSGWTWEIPKAETDNNKLCKTNY